MIEIPDIAERDDFLVQAKGLEQRVALTIAGRPYPATWDKGRELDDCTSAVHYLKFPLGREAAGSVRAAARATTTMVQVLLSVDHPAYRTKVALPPETIASLGEDLEG